MNAQTYITPGTSRVLRKRIRRESAAVAALMCLLLSCGIAACVQGALSEDADSAEGERLAYENPADIGVGDVGPGKATNRPLTMSPVKSSRAEREAKRLVRKAVRGDSLAPSGTKKNANGVWLAAQESTSSYVFSAETGCCYDDHDWYLVNEYGDVWDLGSTGLYQNKIVFSMPKTIPDGEYWVELDAYIWDYATQTWLWWGLWSNDENVPILVATPDVGVIPNASSCPSPDQEVVFFMDNEDHNEQSSITGWVGATTLDSNGNTTFTFCRVSGNQFRALNSTSSSRSDYAVLKLGANCPAGAVEVTRRFDNEDHNNMNDWSGNISPSTNIEDTIMKFCLFKGASSYATGLPNLGFSYGVFADSNFGFKNATGRIYTDDEDGSSNNNYYDADQTWKNSDSDWQAKVNRIISGGLNTTLETARKSNPYCNDGVCNGIETSSSCPSDCEACGNGVCRMGENAYNCPQDCDYCGNGICGIFESGTECPQDCGTSCIRTEHNIIPCY